MSQARINRLISENRAIVGEPQLKRHGSKKSAAVSPPLPPPPLQCAVVTARQQEESERWEQAAAKESSRLAFALLGPPSPPQPLNLSTPKAVQPFDNPEGSIIKDILLKARSGSQYRRQQTVPSSVLGLLLVNSIPISVQIRHGSCPPVTPPASCVHYLDTYIDKRVTWNPRKRVRLIDPIGKFGLLQFSLGNELTIYDMILKPTQCRDVGLSQEV
ncbi:hypothetical protein AAG570_002657 [Ranatra chinensis]|uniref:Uncharacterized protein n=1 Tax=Ranatra chinensis TaxID=642074 RepID=A0ABD0Y893_9HEMI